MSGLIQPVLVCEWGPKIEKDDGERQCYKRNPNDREELTSRESKDQDWMSDLQVSFMSHLGIAWKFLTDNTSTSRNRHVKCDETKPSCIRCANFGRKCDGYVSRKHIATNKYSRNNGKVVIKPRPNPLVIRNPTVLIPGSTDERCYFQRFCQTTSQELSGVFANIFWSQIVPQAALHEVSIRHAVTAIAALTKTLEAAPTSSHRVDIQTARDEHHKFAIEQYIKAISSVRKALATKQSGIRTALIVAILFVCIETLQGDQRSALHQLHQGLALLHQVQRVQYEKDAEQRIEEDLLQMWVAQNVQSYYLCFAQASLHPPMLPQHLQERHRHVFSSSMPRFFNSISNAKRALNLLMNATAHFHHCSTSEPFEKVRQYAEHHARLSQWEAAFRPLLRRAQAEGEASEGLCPISSETRVPTLLLSVYHRVALIILAGAITPTETMYDSLTREFSYIVSTVQTILEISNLSTTASSDPPSLDNPPKRSEKNSESKFHSSRFTFDVSVLPPLHIVGSKCRDPLLRREAIRLLRQCRVQEGLWAPHGMAEMCNWMMEVEEAGMTPESDRDGCGESGSAAHFFIPEERRVRLTGMLWELDKKRVWMQCTGAVALPGLDGREERPVWEKPIT